jgi:hypothetical protein
MTNPEAMVLRRALGGREAGRGKRYCRMADRPTAILEKRIHGVEVEFCSLWYLAEPLE